VNVEACENDVPLFVDLDGTLVRTDTSTESAFRLIRRNIAYVFVLPFWLLRGKAYLKDRVARRVPLDVTDLPYRENILEFLREQRSAGRKLTLATAANHRHARQVADHLGIFGNVLASDQTHNLEGHNKLARMAEQCADGPFDYAADDLADMVIFRHARRAIVVAPPAPMRKAIEKLGNVERVLDPQARSVGNVRRAMRPARLLMNLLILLPSLLSGAQGSAWFEPALGVVSFSLAASANYLFDDLLHLSERRRLPQGQRGVVVAGGIGLQRAGMAVGVFWVLAFALALPLPGVFSLAMAGYVLLSIVAVQDWFRLPRPLTAMALAVSRIAAGAALVAEPLSIVPWLSGLAVGALVEISRRHKTGFL
jgi:phosphoserine phosphatase